jgi:hypothetical protein
LTTADPIAYAMSDMAPSSDGRLPAGCVSVPPPAGCGQQHQARTDGQGRPYVECRVCAPWLIGHVHGFASTPAGVPLTPDEMGEVEISKRQGEVSYSLAMKAMGQTMAQMIQQGQSGALSLPARQPAAPGAPGASRLREQLAMLSADERAEIAALLAAPTAGSATQPGSGPGGPEAPARRGPGRPRKAS